MSPIADIQAQEIEQIVRRVLGQLLAEAGGSSVSDTPTGRPGELVVSDRLVSLASLPKDLSGVQRLSVDPRAVVTPAARDRLRQANITLIREHSRPASANAVAPSASTLSLSSPSVPPILVAGQAVWYRALSRSLCPRQTRLLPAAVDDASALRSAASGLREGYRAAVVVAAAPHALCWQAARDEKLRPAVVGDWSQWPEIVAQVPANLLLLSSQRWNAASTANLIRHFTKHLKKVG
jgi:hypothetical protein